MKRKALAFLLILAAAAWLSYLAGCTLFPVTVEGRVDQFVAGLDENDRSTMYLNFDSAITMYNDIKDPAFWDAAFDPLDAPYFLAALDTTNPSNITFQLTNSSAGSWNVTMEMVQVGESWFITRVWLDANPFVW